jgi:CRISPR-associated protein Csm2
MQIQLWQNRDAGHVHPELFSSTAEKLAQHVFQGQLRNNKLNKPTQLRKFYDEVVRFDGEIKSFPAEQQEDEFKKQLPYLKMLNAKAAYAMARDLISSEFKEFIASAIQQIHEKKDFDAFYGLFEAFMGFYKFYDEKGERPQKNFAPKGGR